MHLTESQKEQIRKTHERIVARFAESADDELGLRDERIAKELCPASKSGAKFFVGSAGDIRPGHPAISKPVLLDDQEDDNFKRFLLNPCDYVTEVSYGQ